MLVADYYSSTRGYIILFGSLLPSDHWDAIFALAELSHLITHSKELAVIVIERLVQNSAEDDIFLRKRRCSLHCGLI